ncbi:hypothetical protein SALB_03624 [Streptomyces noursei]|uniref:Uncharacterized protein n=1 Tax=Streptomyces noursei TaxID=1971 RepID=A0A401QZX0_STRNR|nr:hypothetical protein SALB_03624 [Streptomyces noursei]
MRGQRGGRALGRWSLTTAPRTVRHPPRAWHLAQPRRPLRAPRDWPRRPSPATMARPYWSTTRAPWGGGSHDTEALVSVRDALESNPERFAHVECFVPDMDERTS